MTKIEKARAFAINAHRSTLHQYDGKPYEKHLEMVVNYAERFKGLITTDYDDVISSAWLHDTIEDCRVTYNDIKTQFGIQVAELVYACTNHKGRNRKDRASAKFYEEMRAVPDAPFVKICDRLANVRYSAETGSKMISAYRKEAIDFHKELYAPRLRPLFDEMDILLRKSSNPENDTAKEYQNKQL